MGKRISYYRNNFNVGFKDVLLEHYSIFRQWYLDNDTESRKKYDEPFGNENLIHYLLQNRELSSEFGILDKRIIDQLTADFIGYYCDTTDLDGEILEHFGSSVGKWRYEGSSEMVLRTNDWEFINLWNFIITHGRSLKDYNRFEGFEDEFKIGFLTYNERGILQTKIETYFGSVEEMQKKYWTIAEKRQLQKAIAKSENGFYSLSQHNPVSSGLEYVLEVLIEVVDNKNEIITSIE